MSFEVASPFDRSITLVALEDAAERDALPAFRRMLLEHAAQLPPGAPSRLVFEGLAAALLLDLALLRAHPSTLLSALYARCAFHGQVSFATPSAPDARLLPAWGSGPLAELAQRWRVERARTRPTSGWVRALLPPPHRAGGPLLAEMGAAGSHELLGVTDEGHVLVGPPPPARRGPIQRWILSEGALSEATMADLAAVASRAPPLTVVTHAWQSAALHDATTGALHAPLDLPEGGNPGSWSFSPDGSLCALAGCGDEYSFGFVRLYETATGRLVRDWETPRPIWSTPVFAPSGRLLLTASERGLLLHHLDTGAEELLATHHAQRAVLSRDEKTLVTTDGITLRVWRLDTLRTEGLPPDPPPGELAFSPNGERLVRGDWLCDGVTGLRLGRLPLHRAPALEGGPPRNAFLCGDQRILFLDGDVRVWSAHDGSSIASRIDASRSDRSVYGQSDLIAFTPDGLRYAAASEHRARVHVHDTDTGALVGAFDAGLRDLRCLALSPDGQRLAAGTKTGQVVVWSAATGERLVTLPGHETCVTDLAFSQDARLLVSAGDDEALRLWDLSTGALRLERPLDARDPAYRTVAAPSTSDQVVTRRSWTATPEALRALSGWGDFPGPSVGRYAVDGLPGATCFIERETGRHLAVFPGGGSWRMHPEGDVWASRSAHVIVEAPHTTTETAKVLARYTPSRPDPISFRLGDPVQLDGRDDLWEGNRWVWATNAGGHGGWIPPQAVVPAEEGAGHWIARRDYSARELDVHPGDRLDILRRELGWCWCRTAQGDCGWIPERDLQTDA
ncbi:SH3 domain-containing protein [Chondromyces crocatus]|uniref:SH3 domain-containing protein n=1 Tax=Chondromyces crocatus TaxID=52 RepID=A0A0K1ED99_CHOCO|nr:SH3 domain-containing protein [Chondromyces crocatus]AKT38824.1 uncharacterized protein CMC5_029700 [Chondromyces crocatus]